MDKQQNQGKSNLPYTELKRLHQQSKKLKEERRKLHSRRQLSLMLTKKFKTTMIGALAAFEEGFGHFWGHNKPFDELNEEESKLNGIWEDTRTEILNNGNSQLRAALEEINHYDLNWNQYYTELVVKQD
tara:strand:- start:63 stop:449 length:387 start_codon:yes stop_codon:yes gene_type:complete